MEINKTQEFNEALNTYYNLKREYENSFTNEKNKIIAMDRLSWKEKRIEYNKLKKKCINCKRPVGTIFECRIDKETEDYFKDKHLIAICGDNKEPCPLKIDLNLGHIVNIYDLILELEQKINFYKNEIITNKNNLLFGYDTSTNVVENFNEIKDTLDMFMKQSEFFSTELIYYTDNSSKKEDLKKLEIDFYSKVVSIKNLIHDFDKTQDTQYVNDVIDIYKTDILPILDKIMKNKYAYCGVEYNDVTNTYHLIQKKFTIQQLETDLGTNEQSIVSMKIGMPAQIKNPKILKNTNAAIPNITRGKKKPMIVIESESSSTSESTSTPGSTSGTSSGSTAESSSTSGSTSESESESESESGSESESESESKLEEKK